MYQRFRLERAASQKRPVYVDGKYVELLQDSSLGYRLQSERKKVRIEHSSRRDVSVSTTTPSVGARGYK